MVSFHHVKLLSYTRSCPWRAWGLVAVGWTLGSRTGDRVSGCEVRPVKAIYISPPLGLLFTDSTEPRPAPRRAGATTPQLTPERLPPGCTHPGGPAGARGGSYLAHCGPRWADTQTQAPRLRHAPGLLNTPLDLSEPRLAPFPPVVSVPPSLCRFSSPLASRASG